MTEQQIKILRTKYRKALRELRHLERENIEDRWKLTDIEFENIESMFAESSLDTHELKTETEYYQAVEKGLKQFELRKNDINFKVGDILILVEVVNEYATGRKLGLPPIKYILHGGKYGLDEGYCILGW
jgi:hypothetical protein